MNNQDMQFADPEWQPPEERELSTNARGQMIFPPQPINANRGEQPPWQSPPLSEGYLGAGYAGSQPQKTWAAPASPTPRRRGSPWRWIILAFIIIALMSSVFNRSSTNYGGPGPQFPFKQPPQTFQVNGVPTIDINSGGGNINVSTNGSSNIVTIQESSNDGRFAKPGDIHSTMNGNIITVVDQGGNFPPEDVTLDVIVPSNANLQITTNGGSIDVENVNLTGSSSLISNGGNVTFNGSLGSGDYQFQSTNGSGTVNVTLPSTSAFHLDASTTSGTISNGFSGVHINGNGNQAQGDVGQNASQTKVTLTSDSGDINLQAS